MKKLLVLLTLILTACAAAPPTASELQSADYGGAPQRYAEAVHAYFDVLLKDPGSAEYQEITAPAKGFMQEHSLAAGTHRAYGWLVYVTVNAKNSYGGYVGFKTYTFLFRGEQIVDHMEAPE